MRVTNHEMPANKGRNGRVVCHKREVVCHRLARAEVYSGLARAIGFESECDEILSALHVLRGRFVRVLLAIAPRHGLRILYRVRIDAERFPQGIIQSGHLFPQGHGRDPETLRVYAVVLGDQEFAQETKALRWITILCVYHPKLARRHDA